MPGGQMVATTLAAVVSAETVPGRDGPCFLLEDADNARRKTATCELRRSWCWLCRCGCCRWSRTVLAWSSAVVEIIGGGTDDKIFSFSSTGDKCRATADDDARRKGWTETSALASRTIRTAAATPDKNAALLEVFLLLILKPAGRLLALRWAACVAGVAILALRCEVERFREQRSSNSKPMDGLSTANKQCRYVPRRIQTRNQDPQK
jgi:hypothetical protein